MKPTLTLEIKNSQELFNNLLLEYADFDKDYLNPRYAMNCAINSWHLTDWTYHEFFTEDERFKDSVNKKGYNVSGIQKYQDHIKKNVRNWNICV